MYHRYHIRYHILCNGNGVEICNGNGVNVIDIIFYVTERVAEQYRYHVLCNGNGVNIIDIIFYVLEKGSISCVM